MAEIAHERVSFAAVRNMAPAKQAFHLLQVAFVVAPIVAGFDKFTDILCNWDKYLAAPIARLSPIGTHGLMMVIGVVEIAAGVLVALKPRIGAYVVAAWLMGIILNLLLAGAWYDVALRDLGLCLGALALGRLSEDRETHAYRVYERPRRLD